MKPAALALGLLVTAIATAAPAAAGHGTLGYIRVDNPDTVYPPAQPDTAFVPPSRILFINWCDGNCVLTGGVEDSRANTSSIITGTRTIAPYSGDANLRAQILACVRGAYARFDLQVVDVDPGNVPHWEAIAAGLPAQGGFQSIFAGIAPFTCGVIPNAITFSFLNLDPRNVLFACRIIAQESAHAFGLTHEFDSRDYMSYLEVPPAKSFVDESLCIGTQGCCQPATECMCGPTMQNSYQAILAVFGAPGSNPPDCDASNDCGPDETASGCCSTGGPDPTAPIGFGVVVAGLLVRRRRARA